MSDTMLERVAKAIHEAYWAEEWSDVSRGGIQYHATIQQARAAIEAMREPTEAMSAALDDQLSLWVQEIGSNEDVYYAAIDAALQPATDSEAK
jgi:hypothetical protein